MGLIVVNICCYLSFLKNPRIILLQKSQPTITVLHLCSYASNFIHIIVQNRPAHHSGQNGYFALLSVTESGNCFSSVQILIILFVCFLSIFSYFFRCHFTVHHCLKVCIQNIPYSTVDVGVINLAFCCINI